MTEKPGKNAEPGLPLFRVEALRAHRGTVFGAALETGPVSFSWVTLSLSLAAAALLAIVVFGSYAQRATVDGFIASADGDIRVYPQASGVVTGLRIREGMPVSAGQTLFSLLTSRNSAMSAEASLEIRDAILAEQQALATQATGQQRYFASESQRLKRSLDNGDAVLGSLQKQRALARRKFELVGHEQQRLDTLGKAGFLAAHERDALAMRTVESEMALEAIELRIAEQQAALQDTQSRIAQLDIQQQTRLAELAAQSGQVAQRLSAAGAGLQQAVSSPVDGRIGALHVLAGQSVRADTLALSIIPSGSLLYAELLVPGRSAGQLQAGQTVDLRFDAYPFEKFGLHGATIEQIAQSLLLPGDARFPVVVAEPVYRVRARLHSQSIDIEGDSRLLTPGLTFKADILTGERTLLEWLLAPVIGASRRL